MPFLASLLGKHLGEPLHVYSMWGKIVVGSHLNTIADTLACVTRKAVLVKLVWVGDDISLTTAVHFEYMTSLLIG